MNHSCRKIFTVFLIGTLTLILCGQSIAQSVPDSSSKNYYPYPLRDFYGSGFTHRSNNAFDLSKDTALLRQNIQYDPVLKRYFIIEKIDSIDYRIPITLTADQYLKLQSIRTDAEYNYRLSQVTDMLNFKQPRPKPRIYSDLFNRIFGLTPDGKKVSVSTQGNIDISLGYQGQNIQNPTLSEQARKTGNFDIKANANMNLLAQIGNKLRLPISYNTQSFFDFNNQFKLQYQGKNDEIIKSIEAGNISFQSKGSLMPSMQNLFGVKAQLQFGKLYLTSVFANSRSQRQSITLQGNGISQQINIQLGNYDENRNFLLGNYFENHYNEVMSTLPVVRSPVRILRMEVWVTNKTGATTNVRNIVGLMDLGENNPYNNHIHSLNSYNGLPDNGANDLYSSLLSNPQSRNSAIIGSMLNARGLKSVDDYEQTYARKLDSTEYTYNPQAGFLSLNQQLQPDQILAVAYQYTYNGRTFQVGEFSQDVALDSAQGIQKVMFLKLLKASSQRVDLPTWQWMMKNVYSLGVYGLQPDNFNLSVYYQQPSGGTNRYLPESAQKVSGQSIISILGADKLNSNNDPAPDGWFDFVNGFTVLPSQGKIIFPVLQPFGKDLDSLAYQGVSQSIKNQYVYYPLYDSIKVTANTYANLNRFLLKGTVKGSSGSQISLGASNIPPGSVTVTAGGRTLTEGTDYTVDYISGTIQILNQSVQNSGTPVNVQFESNTNLGTASRNFVGLRLDYVANSKLSFGATMEKLSEQPYTFKTNYGQDPINNTMYGIDMNYRSQWPGLTRFLDKLPFYSTTAPSSINVYGEGAVLKPGHPNIVGSGGQGQVYIDDFESSSNIFDLRYPLTAWALASTPAGNGLFPEADLNNNLDYGKNRARLSWYNIEPTLQDRSNTSNPLHDNLSELSDPRVRPVYANELFPQQSNISAGLQTTTFDLSYFPTDKGPYNFTDDVADIDRNGHLSNPQKRWGGIMRAIDQTDFETDNVEYIEFWMQDPFIKDPQSAGGKLIFNLGDVSEDILKDGRRFYENGLATPSSPAGEDSSSVWGAVPINPIQLTNAFSNNAADRPFQDVGFDGIDNAGERRKQSVYLQNLANNFGTDSPVYQEALNDPSGDDYKWYRDPFYTQKDGILARYKYYNNPQGNSPIAGSGLSSAATMYPDNEDLNGDNTLNQNEQYYEYEIDLKPGMTLTDKYVADIRTITPKLANDSITHEHWYLFRIPIKDFTNKIGNISDFKSIRFMRMYLTGFRDSATLRFAELGLVRNTWRPFTYMLDTTGSYTNLPANNTSLTVLSVNTQDNSARQPIPYKMPPGVQQVQSLTGGSSISNGSIYLEKEQSMSLRIANLEHTDSRSVFKNMNLDMRKYGEMSMFFHAESIPGQRVVNNNDLTAVIRIGQDFLDNYYEIRIPLQVTLPGATATAEQIWPELNHLKVELQNLVQLKLRRNSSGQPISTIYREPIGNQEYSIKGNPNLGQVTSFLIGVENDQSAQPLSCEVWVDELALSKISEQGGWAAQGRVDMQLADLGTVSLSANTYSAGWGSIEQNTNQRSTNGMLQVDASANIDAGRLFPSRVGFSIPVFASYNKTILSPQYDPYDQDVLYKDKLNSYSTAFQRDSVKRAAVDQTTTKTISFTNVRLAKQSMRPKIWSLSNFDFSYSFTQINQSNPLIEKNNITKYYGGVGYTYNGQPKYWQPFKRLFASKSPWLAFIRDFNINPNPQLLSFRATADRQMGIYTPRIVDPFGNTGNVDTVQTSYDKYFRLSRIYNLSWNFTRSLNINFTANNQSFVDEPYGLLDTKAKKDSMWTNFWRGGRNTQYAQNATLAYTLPFAKMPFADWMSMTYSYAAGYNWMAASLLARSLGNIIENNNTSGLNAQLDFRKLYNKSKYLRKVLAETEPNKPVQAQTQKSEPQKQLDTLAKQLLPRAMVIKGLKGRAKRSALIKWRQLKRQIKMLQREVILEARQPIKPLNAAIRLVTMVKSASASYTLTNSSRLPGYMDSTKFLGEDMRTNQPGMAYILGKMPTRAWLDEKARQHILSTDPDFNDMYRQNYSQNLTVNAALEPIRDLLIDISAMKSLSRDYSELFKDTIGNGDFSHLSPYSSGGFTVSYASLKSLFSKPASGNISATFKKFSDFRQIISQRLAASNPYYRGGTDADGFAAGYGRYAQDVLIPAFLAAYTGKSPYTVDLLSDNITTDIKSNPLGHILPLPNWSITYNGLSKIGNLSSIFSSIVLKNTYSGTLAMNSFTSALNFQDPLMLGAPSFIDPTSGNYVPYFLIPNLTISESYSPLAGIDVTLANQSTFSFQYSRTRQLSLSLIDYQVSEVNSTEYALGVNLTRHNVNLPFLTKHKIEVDTKNAKATNNTKNSNAGNDLSFGLNLAMSDQLNTNTTLDQTNNYSTGGQKVISISPFINYVLNNRINLKLFFNQTKTVPYLSTTPPITVTNAGLQIRMSLQ